MRPSLVTTRPPVWMFCITILLASGMVWHYFKFFLPQVTARQHTQSSMGQSPYLGIDLYQCWIGARELFRSRVSPYSDEVTRQTQTELYGRPIDHARPGDPKDEHRFPYPLYMVFLIAPFATLPFESVRVGAMVVWIILSLAAFRLWTKSFAPDWHRGWLLIGQILVLSSYPVLEAIFAEQLAMLVSFLMAAAILAIRRDDLRFAGIMLAIATIKPQLVLLLVSYLFLWTLADWSRRKRLLYGSAGMLTLLLIAAEIALPDWFLQWFRTIIAYRTYTLPPLANYLLGSLLGALLSIALVGGFAWMAWTFRAVAATSREFFYTVAAALAVTVIVFPTADAVYDHVLQIPALLALFQAPEVKTPSVVTRGLALLGVVAILWPWISASTIVLWSWITPSLEFSEFLSLLPIRTAASIPFVLLALLGLRLRGLVGSPHDPRHV